MRAMILDKPGPLSPTSLREGQLPVPEPGPGEILVRVTACGVCRTDLHTVEGELDLPKLPIVPGHQVVGVVEKAGKGVERFSPGDRVGASWLASTCALCRYCKAGRENLCPSASFTGYHRDGGYAEFMVASEGFSYAIPEGFPDVQAAPLLCAGIIGYRALRLSGIEPGGRLGLYGFGGSAHVTIQVAKHMGCEVYVVSRGEGHRSLAGRLGAAWVGGSHENPPVKLDAAIIFAPAGEIVPPALESVDWGGTVVLAGIHVTTIPALDYSRYLFHERVLRSVTANTRRDGEELMALAAEIPIAAEVTPFALSEANGVLRDLKGDRIDGTAVLIP
ncbi:MAG: zinc-dependent alcohol dehydrogenase family protein [bacterium]|nr:MAG: zinc-dependent alcohol dehydrogenase family protein [bacterium]